MTRNSVARQRALTRRKPAIFDKNTMVMRESDTLRWYERPAAERTVAIFGTRDYPNLKLVREVVRSLGPDARVVTPGRVGVERVADGEARALFNLGKQREPMHYESAPQWDEVIIFDDGGSEMRRQVLHWKHATIPVTVYTPAGERITL